MDKGTSGVIILVILLSVSVAGLTSFVESDLDLGSQRAEVNSALGEEHNKTASPGIILVLLKADPATISQGEGAVLTWDISGNNADICIATAFPSVEAWNGEKSSFVGSYSESIWGIQETTTFSLECTTRSGRVGEGVTEVTVQ